MKEAYPKMREQVKIIVSICFTILVTWLPMGCSSDTTRAVLVRASNENVAAFAGYGIKYGEPDQPTAKIPIDNNVANATMITDAPVYRLNQNWKYRNANNHVWDRTVTETGSNYYIVSEEISETQYDKNLNIIKMVYAGSTIRRPWAIFNFPLYVGKSWDFDTDVKSSDGKLHNVHVSNSVVSYGDVHVEAGSFKAYRIYQQVNAGRRIESFFYWYAPEVGTFVKRTARSSGPMPSSDFELVSYSK